MTSGSTSGLGTSRTSFHRTLERLQDQVLVLGSMVEKATLRAVDNLKRMADRVQNICERVVFMVTGRMHEFSRGPLG